jgi:hypothetical protein
VRWLKEESTGAGFSGAVVAGPTGVHPEKTRLKTNSNDIH